MRSPRISVLMPCYNHGAFIDEAIASVLGQTYDDFEIVVVDDGSTDPATIERLQQLSTPRTRVVRSENRGLPAARNLAAKHAIGALFCALDADDRLAPTWFEKAVARLDSRPALAFVSHWLETFGDEHWTWKPKRCDLESLLFRNTVNGAALVRREVFEAVGGYEESMRDGCEDWDFWLRVVERGYRGEIIPEILFYYRRRAESMSRVMSRDHPYPRPLDTIVARHEPAFREHVVDHLVRKEDRVLRLLSEAEKLERDHLLVVEPSLSRAREELAALRVRVERARPGVAAEQRRCQLEAENARLEAEAAGLEAETARLQGEVTAIRDSRSWRVTAPLRRVYSWVTDRR